MSTWDVSFDIELASAFEGTFVPRMGYVRTCAVSRLGLCHTNVVYLSYISTAPGGGTDIP